MVEKHDISLQLAIVIWTERGGFAAMLFNGEVLYDESNWKGVLTWP